MQALLSAEQKEILVRLVQAHRSLPRSARQPFLAFPTAMRYELLVSHQGLGADELGIYPEDLRTLASAGVIHLLQDGSLYQFDITEFGFRAYEDLQRSHSAPAVALEEEATRYLGDPGFQRRHTAAYAKWKAAADLLWSADAVAQLTQIGHLCREAGQEFATSVAKMRPPPRLSADPAKTQARVQAVLENVPSVGDAELGLLKALHGFWSATVDYVQRQEHGGQKEGEALTWEDGRRAILATLLSMYELDRSVHSRRTR
jgi:hypothetical protein